MTGHIDRSFTLIQGCEITAVQQDIKFFIFPETLCFCRFPERKSPNSHSRKQVIPTNDLSFDFDTSMPLEVAVGGATIFVVDVDRFEKV